MDVVPTIGQRLDAANTQMLDGDWSRWRQLLSSQNDVALLGAYGTYVTGWADLEPRFERTARGYAGCGGQSTHETVASWIGGELACMVAVERHDTRLGGKPAVFKYRSTHVFRLEDGIWRGVLRHADPLVAFQGSDIIHSIAMVGEEG